MSNKNNKKCAYGCGQEAEYQLKNGKWCCSESHNSCPALREKNSESRKGQEGHKPDPDNYTYGDCQYCGKEFRISGLTIHEKACPHNPDNKTYCKECGKLLTGKYQTKFCSHSCACEFNNRKGHSTKGKTEMRECPGCGEQKEFSIYGPKKDTLCQECDKKRRKKKQRRRCEEKQRCNYCGRTECNQDNRVCEWLCGCNGTFEKLGGDIKKVGTIDIFDRVEKLIDTLYDEYNNGESGLTLCDKYDVSNMTIYNLFKKFNKPTKSSTEAYHDSIENERREPRTNIDLSNSTNYKSGWHETWFGEEVFLRSSYEFEYAKRLDKQEIYYRVEELRIPYKWRGVEHLYIPDFYIPSKNLIVEVKSEYFYKKDKKKVDRKLKACEECGYETKLWMFNDKK